MGLFDNFRSSYDLGPGFTEVQCQTKEMEEGIGIGGTMSQYWLSPGGYLYQMTYRGTHTFEIIEEGDIEYKENLKFLNYRWVPTGAHGKVEPYRITKYVEVYPEQWDGEWEEWPRMKLHFKSGKLVEYRRCLHGEGF